MKPSTEWNLEVTPGSATAAARSSRKLMSVQSLVLPALLVIAIFLIYPLIKIVIESFMDPGFTLKHYIRFFQEPAYFQVLWNTLRIGFSVTVITLLLAYPVAYMLATVSARWQNLLLICVLLPFWTSFLVRTYAWIVLLQKEGIVNKALMGLGLIAEPLKMVHNSTGVLVGLSHVLLPFMILPLYSVMKNIDLELMKAAQSLGATPFRSFIRVFFPLSLPGVAAGSILVFIISIGYYVTPALLGGRKDTMISQLIAQQIGEQLNWQFGSAIAFVLLILVLFLLYLFNKFVGMDKISFGS